MTQSRWFFHPIFIFVVSILALATSLFLYIYWYMEASTGLERIMNRFNMDAGQALASETWIVVLVLSLLVGVILMGIFIIFVYNIKILQLYRLQNNFINNFTHELKTPVTSLKLYLETFKKHRLPRDNQLKYLDYMIQDTDRLTGAINSILDLARIESGRHAANYVLKDLAETLAEFFQENAHLVENCQITIDVPEDRRFLYRIDPMLFDMLLMNLATNALKYNQSTAPTLAVSLSSARRGILIRFQDNGVGLEKREFRKIFRKFYQVGHADNRSARGSGIGLYIAQSISKIHGGRLSVESDGAGKGSVFTLTLPNRRAAVQA